MNVATKFFSRKVPLTNWQLSVLKLASFCIGCAVGCFFADFFKPFVLPLVVAAVVAGVWFTGIWLKAMKENS